MAALTPSPDWTALTRASVSFHLACAHEALGDADAAVEHFSAVLDAAPQLDLARRAAAGRDHARGPQPAPVLTT